MQRSPQQRRAGMHEARKRGTTSILSSMLTRIDVRGPGADLRAALRRANPSTDSVTATVRDLIERVRVEGDAALRDLTERFDGCRLDSIAVPRAEIDAALNQ